MLFKLTAFEDLQALDRFLIHAERLLNHTSLRALLSVNIARQRITFRTLISKRLAGTLGQKNEEGR